MGLTCDPLKPSQKVPLISGRLAVNPCSVRHDGLLGRKDALDSVKSNMSLRGAATRSYFVFQKNSQDLDALERAIGRIREFQDNILSGIDESKSKGFLFNIHHYSLLLVLRWLPFFLLFPNLRMSPG